MTDKKKLPPLIQGYGAENILRLLKPLKETQTGHLIYRHVAHSVGEMERTHQKICLGYASVLINFITILRKQLPADSLLNLELKLIQQRLHPPITINELSTLQAYLKNTLELVDEVSGHDEQMWLTALQPLTEQFNGNQPVAQKPDLATLSATYSGSLDSSASIDIRGVKFPEPEAPAKQPAETIQTQVQDSSPPQNFEQQQNKLINRIFDAMQQQARFGLLLEEMLDRLKTAESKRDIENVRELAIQELQRMLSEQSYLVRTLNETHDFANMVRQSSQQLSQELKQVRVLSLTDELTELPNRRAFMQRLEEELQRAKRYRSGFCVALLDLDHFKQINDTYGHAAGDEMLRNYANNILSVLRRSDMVARYGGEEFAIIFPYTTLEEARQALEKVKLKALKTVIPHNGGVVRAPGFSAGLVVCKSNEDADTLMDRADRLLYGAKERGRNRIEIEHTDATFDNVHKKDY